VVEVKLIEGEDTPPWGCGIGGNEKQHSECAQIISYAYYMTNNNKSREAAIAYWVEQMVFILAMYRKREEVTAWNSIRVAGIKRYRISQSAEWRRLHEDISKLLEDQMAGKGRVLEPLGIDRKNLQLRSILHASQYIDT